MRLRDLLMSATAIAVLVLLIALTDDRVRDRLRAINAQTVSYHVVNETYRVGKVTARARDLALDNGVLATVVIAGAVLFVFMLRT